MISSRFWLRSVMARGCGKTPREKPARLYKRLITKSARKTTVRIFQITLERGLGGGKVNGGGAWWGVGMTGGGVTGGVVPDSGDGGWSSIMSGAYRKPRWRASANATRFENRTVKIRN
jgi:hypothetical protein